MRVVWTLPLWILAGCEQAGDDFPLNPGGGGGATGGTSVDAAEFDDDGGTDLSARVCLVTDLRTPGDLCASSGADGFTVTLGARTATTATDGSFTIERPTSANLVWRVTGNGIVTSVKPFTTDLVIPAISTTRYNELLLANGILLAQGQGSVVASVVRAGAALPNASATTQPEAQFVTLYDTANANVWAQVATGTRGTAWITGLAAGAALLRVTHASAPAQEAAVPVEDQAITFVTIEIP
jgi:hypothetical protein